MNVTANLLTTSQLDAWMSKAVGRTQATCFEWSYAGRQLLGVPDSDLNAVPDCALFGFPAPGAGLSNVSSGQFLDQLRQYQLSQNAQNPGAGGSASGGTGTTAGSLGAQGPTGTTGQGVLGLTNCSICRQLAANPLLLLLLGVGIYFLLF